MDQSKHESKQWALKWTYFILFAGYGATLPYLPLYFRQIGLNASYVGAIAGIRPMVQFISCPFWAIIADRFNLRRFILNMSIFTWLLMTCILYIPKPNSFYCFSDIENSNSSLIPTHTLTQNQKIYQTEVDLSSKRKTIASKINSFQLRNPENYHISQRQQIIKLDPEKESNNNHSFNLSNSLNSTAKYSNTNDNRNNSLQLPSRTITNQEYISNLNGANFKTNTNNQQEILNNLNINNDTTYDKTTSGDNKKAESGCEFEKRKKSFHKPVSAVFIDEDECVPLVFYEMEQIRQTFIIIFIVTAVGEFFEAPSVSLLDTAIIDSLNNQLNKYGHIRLFGSLGFGVSSFFVGLTLDHTHKTICDKTVTDFNSTLYFFVVLMGSAFVSSIKLIRFKAVHLSNDLDCQDTSNLIASVGSKKECTVCSGSPIKNSKNLVINKKMNDCDHLSITTDNLNKSHKNYNKISNFGTTNNSNNNIGYTENNTNNLNTFMNSISSSNTSFDSNDYYSADKKRIEVDGESKNDSSLYEVYLVLKKPRYALFLAVSLFMGFSHGGIMNFVNWFLEDLGATRFMMGVATITRDFAVVFGFYISSYILKIYSETNITVWSFFIYIFSYFSYSIIINPWYVIPIESLQGLAYALMWSACITFLGKSVSPKNSATMQGIIQGIYWGLGSGLGAIVGGISIHNFGTQNSFRYGGYLTVIVFILFGCLYTMLERHERKLELKSKIKIQFTR